MIAIGIVDQDAQLPPGLSSASIDSTQIAIAQPADGLNPRDRLRHAVGCFQAGIGILAMPPLQPITMTMLKCTPKIDDLRRQFRKSRHLARFSITMQAAQSTCERKTSPSGRAWLAQREKLRTTQASLRHALHHAAKGSETLFLSYDPRGEVYFGEFLTSRSIADRVLESTASRIRKNQLFRDKHVAITGPWPPQYRAETHHQRPA